MFDFNDEFYMMAWNRPTTTATASAITLTPTMITRTDDANDAFPNDPSETDDFHGDGVGDNADTDDDGDGVRS